MAATIVKGEWKFTTMVIGAPCAMMSLDQFEVPPLARWYGNCSDFMFAFGEKTRHSIPGNSAGDLFGMVK